MAERAHNLAIANDVDVVPLGCLRAILDQLTRRRLRVQTRTFLYRGGRVTHRAFLRRYTGGPFYGPGTRRLVVVRNDFYASYI